MVHFCLRDCPATGKRNNDNDTTTLTMANMLSSHCVLGIVLCFTDINIT